MGTPMTGRVRWTRRIAFTERAINVEVNAEADEPLATAHELLPVAGFPQLCADFPDHSEQSNRLRTLDLVPGIARLVIIAMQSREEEKHRHLLGGEGGVIARSVPGAV